MPARLRPTSTLADADGWWIEARCSCGRTTLLPCRMLARDLAPDRTLQDVARRLRCRGCQERPQAVDLVENPQAEASGYVGSGEPRRVRVA